MLYCAAVVTNPELSQIHPSTYLSYQAISLYMARLGAAEGHEGIHEPESMWFDP